MPALQKGLYEVNANERTLDMVEICEAEDPE